MQISVCAAGAAEQRNMRFDAERGNETKMNRSPVCERIQRETNDGEYNRMRKPVLLSVGLSLLISVRARSDNWPNWRGPSGNGVAPAGKYPLRWSRTENIAWKVQLPGPGASTPVVWDKRIFLTCGVEGQNALLCYDRNGKELWRTMLGEERPGKNKKATGSNPSATTDGQHVFAYFKSGELACTSCDGKIVWRKNLQSLYGADTLWWDLGTSPVLTQRNLVVACMHSGPSYLAAFDKASGEVVWKVDRNLGAPEEAAQSYTTPVVVRDGERETIVLAGADHVTGHDAGSGAELWRVGGLNPGREKYFRSIASPVVADGHVIAPYARGQTLTAIRLGGTGDVTESHVAWVKNGISADVPTPAAANGKVFVCTDRGLVACLDVRTGESLAQRQIEKHRQAYSSSPILADGRIYVTREDGTTFVMDATLKLEIVAQNSLEEFTVATPIFIDGQILVRTIEHLYCVGAGT